VFKTSIKNELEAYKQEILKKFSSSELTLLKANEQIKVTHELANTLEKRLGT
jgi:hypothetical protein